MIGQSKLLGANKIVTRFQLVFCLVLSHLLYFFILLIIFNLLLFLPFIYPHPLILIPISSYSKIFSKQNSKVIFFYFEFFYSKKKITRNFFDIHQRDKNCCLFYLNIYQILFLSGQLLFVYSGVSVYYSSRFFLLSPKKKKKTGRRFS